MKKVFTSNEIDHVFARQSQAEGRTATKNIFFEGKKIYSYGYHFCMANIIDLNTVFITTRKYSVTTSGHLSGVRYALNHFENKVYIPYPEKDIAGNAQYLINEIKSELSDYTNTRKRETTRATAANNLRSIVHNVDKFLEVTKVKLSTRWTDKELQKEFNLYYTAAKNLQDSATVSDKVAKLFAARERARVRAQKERIAECLKSLVAWRNGSIQHSVIWQVRELPEVYLRINADNEVETSKGARVSLGAAKILYMMIKAGRDIKGHVIDGYTVISINGVLTIGCHKIATAEVERFATSQGW